MNNGSIMLILEPEPEGRDRDGADRFVRLRRLLKTLLRAYGWHRVFVGPSSAAQQRLEENSVAHPKCTE